MNLLQGTEFRTEADDEIRGLSREVGGICSSAAFGASRVLPPAP